MCGLAQRNCGGSKKGVKKQCRCQNSSTVIRCRRLSLFSILLNWPLGLIIPLAEFRCHTVWEVVAVVMGWGCVLTGQGQRLRRGRGSADVQVWSLYSCVTLTSHTAELSLFNWPVLSFNCALLQSTSNWKPTSIAATCRPTSLVQRKAQANTDANKTHLFICCFFEWRLRQWLF